MFPIFFHKKQRGPEIQFGLLWGSLRRVDMKRNFLGILTAMTVALLISVPLSAQTIAKVDVPFDFTVGHTQMSAGTYEISSPGHGAIVIRDTKAAASVMSIVNTEPSRNNDSGTKLLFNRYGDKYFLSQVSRGFSGGVMQLPTSKLEKEVRIASSSVSQRVVVAEK
jgi:hypothetical protein